LAGIGAGWVGDVLRPSRQRIRGRIVGNVHGLGHRLRTMALPAPSGPPRRTDVVVIGSGASGLSAAWRLAPTGLEVTVLEAAPWPGGTSAWQQAQPIPYPWGSHYLPVPNPELRATLRLLYEHGVVTGWDGAGRPQFDPEVLCRAPEERLFYQGKWHLGLVPDAALSARERAQMDRFRVIEQELIRARGSDGRPAFQLPFEQSSRDVRLLELDRISMAQWLTERGLDSPFVRWYVRYGMLDDFGAELETVSAWAGLHYFASRKLETEQTRGSRFLVWPQGNGWLVERLLEAVTGPRLHGALVLAVRPARSSGVEVLYFEPASHTTRRIEARAAIVATPAFVARRILAPRTAHQSGGLLRPRAASPWLVANLQVRWPVNPDLPWDSVIHDAAGLGYVHAGHQQGPLGERLTLTYYQAFGGRDVAASRTALLGRRWDELADHVLADLSPAHPELPEQTQRIDVMIWGHGMPRPQPGFLGPEPFATDCLLDRHIAWAHVDQTGFALFEEANQRGVRAAEAIADALGAARGESWL